jgi:hypothetical protein
MVMGYHGRSARVLLLPHLDSRLIDGWLYNGAGAVDRRTVPLNAQCHRELDWPGYGSRRKDLSTASSRS